MTQFSDFGLAAPILAALQKEGHTTPTPIQAAAIPALLTGRDLLGKAQTGSGKTAAFALPTLHRLSRPSEAPLDRALGRNMSRADGRAPAGAFRCLTLAPTRELASQVRDRFVAYGAGLSLRTSLAIGGVPINKQKSSLRNGVDILVATPGRLVDLMNQDAASLDRVEIFILDEVDQMLDLGFIHAIRRIAAKLPKGRQNLFFSATLPPEISKLANALLTDPVRVETIAEPRPQIEQRVRFVEPGDKPAALADILADPAFTRGLVFTRTKRGADKVSRALANRGVEAPAIHGDRSQGQRERALAAFRDGRARVLVATDIAARGIDVVGVSHVVNYDLPHVPETYVHRIGRTARAGASGVAVSLCSAEERDLLRGIEKLTGVRLGGGSGEPRVGAPERRPQSRDGRRSASRTDGDRRPPRARPDARSDGRSEGRSEGRSDSRPQARPDNDRRSPGDADHGRPNQPRSAERRPDHDRPERGRTERGRPEQGRDEARPARERAHWDPARGETFRGEPSRSEHARGDLPRSEFKGGEFPRGDRPRGESPRGASPHRDRPARERDPRDARPGDAPRRSASKPHPVKQTAGAPAAAARPSQQHEGARDGEGRTHRIRRDRNRSAPGRQLSGPAR